MILTLLLDLDDTLLETNMQAFVPAYFQALARHLADRVKPEVMLPALLSGTQLMLDNQDPSRTLQEIFEADFYPKLGIPKLELRDSIELFYDEVFPTLGSVTRRRPGAAELIEWAFSSGQRVAIATDPLFPLKATFQRIRWAGFDPQLFDLVSSFESFHFSKSHPAYYAEMLGRLGWPDGPVLMVGNDIERDLRPAQSLGLKTYHVNGRNGSGAGPDKGSHGDLRDLLGLLKTIDLSSLEPTLQTATSFLPVMVSTPAVLQGLFGGLERGVVRAEPSEQDWAVIEVLCHLRDTEREIHHPQIRMLLDLDDPFLPRPDASVWAKQRNYLGEDAAGAIRDFTIARLETLRLVSNLDGATLLRKARHAIFGPTNFNEVISFIADHDRMHIQQAWATLKVL